METFGSRLKYVIELKQLNPNKVSKLAGIHATTIKNYMTDSVKPDNLKLDIVSKVIGVSKNWLLTGEGEIDHIYPKSHLEENNMVAEESFVYETAPEGKFPKKKGDKLIPFHEVDFMAGNSVGFFDDIDNEKPAYFMDVPEFYGCKAFRAYSNSMEPIISSGNIILCTKVNEWNVHLEYGQIYGIVCNDGRKYLKKIKKYRDNPKEYFLLESENREFDEFELPLKSIKSVWLIHGWLNRNT